MNIIKAIYRLLIPSSIRLKIIESRREQHYKTIKSSIVNHYKNNVSHDVKIKEALLYLEMNEISVFPYLFFNNYKNLSIKVFRNHSSGLPYVLHRSNKLFFKRAWTDKHIIDAYSFLLAEQDPESAHCYLTTHFNLTKDTVIVDVGSAEGIFCLNEIEHIKHIYLIETDNEWIEALKETYKPWQDKITIINKFISDKNSEQYMTLDSYFSNIPIDFLKIDVDGAEAELLAGADIVLSNGVKQLAICTYHKNNDYEDFSKYLLNKKYNIQPSEGYMLFYFDEHFAPPYFRKGLIRGTKHE